jgi:hypothetical protein
VTRRTFAGGCHCGRVRFEVQTDTPLCVVECNCSMCSRCGYLHLLVPRHAFVLLGGADQLATYTFNTGVARHLFCRTCGVKSFYVPRSHPDGISVNARCLDGVEPGTLQVGNFEGRDWDSGRATYRD